MEQTLKAGDSGTIRRLLWGGGTTARVEGCPKDSGRNIPSISCLQCIHYGGFFDDQNRAINVPQVAIGAGRVRRALNLICNTTIEALSAAAKIDETRQERDLRTQRETSERKSKEATEAKKTETRESNADVEKEPVLSGEGVI